MAGFSLIESLLAVLVTGIIFVALATAAALSVAVRVQARRIDLANQAARSYIDGVRSGIIDTANFPPYLRFDPLTPGGFSGLAAITAAQLNDNDFKANVTGIRVDTNGNGFSFNDPADLIIQPMRSSFLVDPGPPRVLESSAFPKTAAALNTARQTLERQGFVLAVRVYRADIFGGDANPSTSANPAGTARRNNDPPCDSLTNFSGNRNISFQGGLGRVSSTGELLDKTCPLVIHSSQVFLSGKNYRDIQQNLNQTN